MQFADEEAVNRDLQLIPPAPSDSKLKSSTKKEKKSKKKKESENSNPSNASVDTEASDGQVTQKKKKKDKSTKSSSDAEVPASVEAPVIETPLEPDYVASKKFAGAKPGYLFKKVIFFCVILILTAFYRVQRGLGITKISMPLALNQPHLLWDKRSVKLMRYICVLFLFI